MDGAKKRQKVVNMESDMVVGSVIETGVKFGQALGVLSNLISVNFLTFLGHRSFACYGNSGDEGHCEV